MSTPNRKTKEEIFEDKLFDDQHENIEKENQGFHRAVYEAMQEYADQETVLSDNSTWLWITDGSVPEKLKGKRQNFLGLDEKGCPYICFYAHYKSEAVGTEECETEEDFEQYDNDAEAGESYLKPGWYEECENSGTYDFMTYKRNIVKWMPIPPQPPFPTPTNQSSP